MTAIPSILNLTVYFASLYSLQSVNAFRFDFTRASNVSDRLLAFIIVFERSETLRTGFKTMRNVDETVKNGKKL